MNRRYVFIFGTILLVIMAAFIIATSQQHPAAALIAVRYPPESAEGKAVRLAMKQHDNRAGDKQVELLFVEDEQEGLAKFLNDPSIVVLLGSPGSSIARTSIPHSNGHGLALISSLATWPGLTKPGFELGEPGVYYPTGQRTFFRTVPSDEIQGLAAARWIGQQGYEQVYILSFADLYSRGLAGIFEANAADFGLEIIGQEEIIDDATSEQLAAYVANVIEAKSQALYFPVPSTDDDWLGLLTQIRAQLPDLVVIGGDGLTQIPRPEDTTLIEGIYGTDVVPAADITQEAMDFFEAYEAEYGERPANYILSFYEAANVALYAIEKANAVTRDALLRSLRNLGEYHGVMGNWTFDANGDTTLTSITLLRLTDGAWKLEGVIKE
jgi:branched-chain amino acid transport system substrate-binding protein